MTTGHDSKTSPTAGTGHLPGAVDQPGDASVELARLLEEYLAALEGGRAPNREAFLAAHPAHASALGEALAGLEFIHRAQAEEGNPRVPVVLGDFRIVREIGRGGMGVVYEAEQLSLKRRVALKVLRAGPISDPVAMQRFQREAETVGRLHHTHIVPIFAIGEEDGVRYYAMQYIEGRDLGGVAQEARKAGVLPEAVRVAGWGRAAAEALAHAHERGVIHRDIKPSNLILDGEDRIWLTDFGLARRSDDITLSLTGALLGTPRYMSPEQAAAIAARPVDHRTDLYSLGATLYELVTGRPIFESGSAHEVLAQILHTEPRAPREWVASLPRDLETIILKCLAKDPDRRYPTAADLAEDLRAFETGRPIRARRPGAWERTTRWLGRNRRMVGASLASSVVGIVFMTGAGLAWRWRVESGLSTFRPTAADPHLFAEVLDARGESLVPILAVAGAKPVRVPAGLHEIRVSAPGIPSESLEYEFQAGDSPALSLALRPSWLWTPRALAAHPSLLEVVPGATGMDLLVLDPVSTVTGGEPASEPTRHRLRQVRGVDGLAAWPQDLVFDETTLPPGGDARIWRQLLAGGFPVPAFAGTGIAERAIDLDQDGHPDWTLISRSWASILAVSGKDGRVLWWHRGRSPGALAAGDPLPDRTAPGNGFVVGTPVVTDLNGDGIGDLIACFRSNGDVARAAGQDRQVPGESWVEALSGVDGRTLWQRPVEAAWANYATSSAGAQAGVEACPRVVRWNGRQAVVLCPGGRLLAWEAATGEPLAWEQKPEFAPEQPPVPVDLDGDGLAGLLVTRRVDDGKTTRFEWALLEARTGRIRWRRTPLEVPTHQASELAKGWEHLGAVVDLGGTRRSDWIGLTERSKGSSTWRFGLEAVDLRTGEVRWEVSLHEGDFPQSVPESARVLPGPDLDGDGLQEVYAVVPGYDVKTSRHGIRVVAVSGGSGREIWRRHYPGVAGARSVGWCQPGSEGRPGLLVVGGRYQDERSVSVVLDSAEGRVIQVLPDIEEARIADLDGDGAPDLLYPFRVGTELRWHAVRAQPMARWRAPGGWGVIPDVDGDGEADRLGGTPDRLEARSGKTGRLIWRTPVALATPVAWHVDADGPEPRVWVEVTRRREPGAEGNPMFRSLAAYALRNGRSLIEAPGYDLGWGERGGTRLGWSFRYPQIRFRDLDGDGIPEVLAAGVAGTGGERATLSVLRGVDGTEIWSIPLVDGALAADPEPSALPLADFNRDGALDLSLFAPAGGQVELDVRDGRTGKSLWPAAPRQRMDPGALLWPEPVVGDLDGDGTPDWILVRHRGYETDGEGYGADLVVVDGASGQVRWTWSWRSGFPEIWPPIFLPPGRPGEGIPARVAMGVSTPEGARCLVFEASGDVVVDRRVPLGNRSFREAALAWAGVDLDGDGSGDLVLAQGTKLVGWAGPDLIERWSRGDAPGGDRAPLRLWLGSRDGREQGVGDRTLVVWWGREVMGLDPGSGGCRWRGGAPADGRMGSPELTRLEVVTGGHGRLSPGLLFPGLPGGDGSTSLAGTWWTRPDGRIRSVEAKP